MPLMNTAAISQPGKWRLLPLWWKVRISVEAGSYARRFREHPSFSRSARPLRGRAEKWEGKHAVTRGVRALLYRARRKRGHNSYQNTTFSSKVIPNTMIARTPGRMYQARFSCLGFSVSEYTRPTNSFSSRGFVKALIAIVMRKHVVHAKIAVQKFCAISLG